MGRDNLKNHITKKRKSGWHGGKRVNLDSYEGTQYIGGRKGRQPNLKKFDNGSVLNQHGVIFTESERKMLESKVNSANRKRIKMLKEEATLPRMVAGRPSGQNVDSLQSMGKESDFILARKSKSLQRFKTKKDFEIYLKNLDRVNSPNYIDERTRLYKRNHMTALKNVFGDDAKDVIMKIRMMKPEDYRRALSSDEMLEVQYIYDPSAKEGKLNQIRASLGMKLKEDYIDDLDE